MAKLSTTGFFVLLCMMSMGIIIYLRLWNVEADLHLEEDTRVDRIVFEQAQSEAFDEAAEQKLYHPHQTHRPPLLNSNFLQLHICIYPISCIPTSFPIPMEASCLLNHHHVSNTHWPARSRPPLRSSHFIVGTSRKSVKLDLKAFNQSGRGVLGIKASEKGKDIYSVKKGTPYTNYAVSLDNPPASFYIIRPLVEILRDLNKRVPDKIVKIKEERGSQIKYIPWYHANRMLSFYAPGWLGEIRSVTYSDDGRSVSVVYRVTIRGSDGEAHRESSGTAFLDDDQFGDPVQKAEEIAFTRACARFGLGLYLYHEDETVKDSN